jgi:hypothetical protein
MKTLFVTSSTIKMYHSSGFKMLSTFLKYNQANLLYCTEHFDLPKTFAGRMNLLTYDLKDSNYLKSWLDKFKNDIPIELGGTAKKFRNRFDKNTQNWNFKASLWFRKVAALKVAYDLYHKEYDQIVWIDIDTEINNKLSNDFLNSLFKKSECFYFLGQIRLKKDVGVESGFIGFRHANDYELLRDLFETYMNGSFKNVRRWDDGYVIKHLVLSNKYKQRCRDSCVTKTTRPMDDPIIRNHILHKKGSHAQSGIDIN